MGQRESRRAEDPFPKRAPRGERTLAGDEAGDDDVQVVVVGVVAGALSGKLSGEPGLGAGIIGEGTRFVPGGEFGEPGGAIGSVVGGVADAEINFGKDGEFEAEFAVGGALEEFIQRGGRGAVGDVAPA